MKALILKLLPLGSAIFFAMSGSTLSYYAAAAFGNFPQELDTYAFVIFGSAGGAIFGAGIGLLIAKNCN